MKNIDFIFERRSWRWRSCDVLRAGPEEAQNQL